MAGPVHDRARAVDQQSAQVGIAALADPEQSYFPAAGVYFGHEAKPGGELPAIPKSLSVARRGDQSCCRDWTNPFHGGQLPAGFARLVYGPKMFLYGLDLLFHSQQFLIEIGKQTPTETRQFIGRIHKDQRQATRSWPTSCSSTIPYSISNPRIWLAGCVRELTSRLRTRCSD